LCRLPPELANEGRCQGSREGCEAKLWLDPQVRVAASHGFDAGTLQAGGCGAERDLRVPFGDLGQIVLAIEEDENGVAEQREQLAQLVPPSDPPSISATV
jgi:hypothetical protein